jgi:carboxyl-terminal processing protease
MIRSDCRPSAVAILAVLTAACSAPPPPPSATPTSVGASRAPQTQTLDQLVGLLEETYLYAEALGPEWPAASAALQTRVEAGLTSEEFAQAVRDLLSPLPDGTVTYRTRAERIEAELAQTDVYEGIGAFVAVRDEPEARIILLSVIGDSPADEAGLEAHEAIYAIDGEPVRAEEGAAAVQRVRGPAGTQVELLIGSPDGSRRTVRVDRGQVTATDPVRAGLLTAGLVYVLAPVTADDTLASAVGGAIEALPAAPERLGMILDLRVAHSTAQWPIVELLTFLADGDLGVFTSRTGETALHVNGQDLNGSQSLPLVLLIGPDTRGAPEILAAALQSQGRAFTVGLPTPGEVLGFADQVLFDGSELVYAVSSFETTTGQDLRPAGVQPDILVEADWDQVSLGQDPVISAAQELLLGQAP